MATPRNCDHSTLYDWKDKMRNGESIILTAFGGGFTWGAVYLTWGGN